MIVSLENNQEKIEIPGELEELLTKAMNIVARNSKLSDNTEVDITIVTDEEIHVLVVTKKLQRMAILAWHKGDFCAQNVLLVMNCAAL